MARKSATLSFARNIASKLDDLRSTRKDIGALEAQAKSFAPVYAIANAIVEFAQARELNKYLYAQPSTYTSWTGEAHNSFSLSIDGEVDSLKIGAVPELIEFIMSFGLEAQDSSDYASEWTAYRTFKFTGKIGGVDMSVRIDASPKSDSPNCRKVQTGTEIKEVAVFEIICD
jgi:hypothetical protein